jgi:hypothetical protein
VRAGGRWEVGGGRWEVGGVVYVPVGKASTVTAVRLEASRMQFDSTLMSVPSTREHEFIKWRT